MNKIINLTDMGHAPTMFISQKDDWGLELAHRRKDYERVVEIILKNQAKKVWVHRDEDPVLLDILRDNGLVPVVSEYQEEVVIYLDDYFKTKEEVIVRTHIRWI